MDNYPQFPKNFYFGSATAAYQIEGGWDADGKGPSTWDVFVRKPGKIKNGDTGDVACNTYQNPQTDIDIMADLEMNAYRFSIAWSRVLPEGKGAVNSNGLAVQRVRNLHPNLNIGITLSQFPIYPYADTPKHQDAAHFADMFMNKFFLDGLYKARYPDALLKRLWPFRPKIKPTDMETISEPTDFLGVNYYTRQYARHVWILPFFRSWVDRDPPPGIVHPILGPHAYPKGIRELLKRYREEYRDPVIYITENGTGDQDIILKAGRVIDEHRIKYLQLYLTELEEGIAEGSDVRGYFMWTMVDNFEWNSGFSHRMGFLRVDHDLQERTIKDSAYWYRDMIRNQVS